MYSAVSNPQGCSKRFYTLLHGKPVQSDAISTSLGSIQLYCNYCAKTIPTQIPTTVSSQVFIQLNEPETYRVTNLLFGTLAQDLNPCSLSRESEALATVLPRWILLKNLPVLVYFPVNSLSSHLHAVLSLADPSNLPVLAHHAQREVHMYCVLILLLVGLVRSNRICGGRLC